MTYADEFKEFVDTKFGFFDKVHTIAEAEQFAQDQQYRFLANNKKLIERKKSSKADDLFLKLQ